MITRWKNVCIYENATIRDALIAIDSEPLRVALVVNWKNDLVGVISDGDIRRGILNGLRVQDEISEIINKNPITAQSNTPQAQLVDTMNELDILFIPILEGQKLVGLETLHDALINKEKLENPVFIMAGGFGTRLRPLTDNCPKPMLNIGNKPILETLIEQFSRFGFHNFYISTHFMPEIIRSHFNDGSKWNVSITYVHEETPLGTGGALGLLPKDLPNHSPIIMINGDVLTNVDFKMLLDFHTSQDADATMCVREYDYQIPYGVITGDGNKIKSMVEKPTHKFFVNAGIYVVSPDIVRSVPVNRKIDMPSLLEEHMEKSNKIHMFPIHEYWLDIGRMDDFNQAQKDILTMEFR